MARIELGCAGHFIASAACQWRRHTEINGYRISSVGNYFPANSQKRGTIGAGPDSFFETYVFRLTKYLAKDSEKCGCHAVADWSEIDGQRYATTGEAQAGHERYVRKYARRKAGWAK